MDREEAFTMTDDLLALYIAGNAKPEVVSYLKGKFDGSLRFKDFAYLNRDKIRKKFSEANDKENEADIASELKVAYLLLLDGRFSLTYEKYKSEKSRRAPDFTAVFQETLPFNVEVKRIRQPPGYDFNRLYVSSSKESKKFSYSVLDNLPQLVPEMPNVWVFKLGSWVHDYRDMQAGLDWLVDQVRQSDDSFFKQNGFDGRTQFCQHWQSLSAVVFLERDPNSLTQPNYAWLNPDATQQLPVEVCDYLEKMR